MHTIEVVTISAFNLILSFALEQAWAMWGQENYIIQRKADSRKVRILECIFSSSWHYRVRNQMYWGPACHNVQKAGRPPHGAVNSPAAGAPCGAAERRAPSAGLRRRLEHTRGRAAPASLGARGRGVRGPIAALFIFTPTLQPVVKPFRKGKVKALR